jgi:hypothetical protein
MKRGLAAAGVLLAILTGFLLLPPFILDKERLLLADWFAAKRQYLIARFILEPMTMYQDPAALNNLAALRFWTMPGMANKVLAMRGFRDAALAGSAQAIENLAAIGRFACHTGEYRALVMSLGAKGGKAKTELDDCGKNPTQTGAAGSNLQDAIASGNPARILAEARIRVMFGIASARGRSRSEYASYVNETAKVVLAALDAGHSDAYVLAAQLRQLHAGVLTNQRILERDHPAWLAAGAKAGSWLSQCTLAQYQIDNWRYQWTKPIPRIEDVTREARACLDWQAGAQAQMWRKTLDYIVYLQTTDEAGGKPNDTYQRVAQAWKSVEAQQMASAKPAAPPATLEGDPLTLNNDAVMAWRSDNGARNTPELVARFQALAKMGFKRATLNLLLMKSPCDAQGLEAAGRDGDAIAAYMAMDCLLRDSTSLRDPNLAQRIIELARIGLAKGTPDDLLRISWRLWEITQRGGLFSDQQWLAIASHAADLLLKAKEAGKPQAMFALSRMAGAYEAKRLQSFPNGRVILEKSRLEWLAAGAVAGCPRCSCEYLSARPGADQQAGTVLPADEKAFVQKRAYECFAEGGKRDPYGNLKPEHSTRREWQLDDGYIVAGPNFPDYDYDHSEFHFAMGAYSELSKRQSMK